MDQERWRTILEFPKYEISNKGNVFNTKDQQIMQTSKTNFGHAKITLTDYDGTRHTRSVPLLVAQAFVPRPNYLCDYLVMLDGNLNNLEADNLTWRPQGFAWKYTRQLKLPQPIHYQNLPVRNVTTGEVYDSIIDAGIAEGLLFEDVWNSTYRGNKIYPNGAVFEIVKRV